MSAVKQFYKGETRDFVVFIENAQKAESYLKDSTIPLSDVVATKFKVFTSENGRGSEGIFHEASRQELQTEFGKAANVEDIIDTIIKKGESKHDPELDRHAWKSTNDSRFGDY